MRRLPLLLLLLSLAGCYGNYYGSYGDHAYPYGYGNYAYLKGGTLGYWWGGEWHGWAPQDLRLPPRPVRVRSCQGVLPGQWAAAGVAEFHWECHATAQRSAERKQAG